MVFRCISKSLSVCGLGSLSPRSAFGETIGGRQCHPNPSPAGRLANGIQVNSLLQADAEERTH